MTNNSYQSLHEEVGVQKNSVSGCSAAEVKEGILESGKADMWLGGLKGNVQLGKLHGIRLYVGSLSACTCVHSPPAPSTEENLHYQTLSLCGSSLACQVMFQGREFGGGISKSTGKI